MWNKYHVELTGANNIDSTKSIMFKKANHENKIKWKLPQTLFEEKLREMKMNHDVNSAENGGFLHPQPI